MRCPKCGGYDVQRSRARTTSEKIARSLLGFHYYRCHSCGHRKSLFRMPRGLVSVDVGRMWRNDRTSFLVVTVVLLVVTIFVLSQGMDVTLGPMTPKGTPTPVPP